MMPPGGVGRIDRKLIHRSTWNRNSRKFRIVPALSFCSTYNTNEHEGTILLPGPHPQPRHRNNKSGNGKARGAKGDRNMQRGRSVHQVLCVNTEPCANAGGEVRGDLHHGVPVASALSPQAYEGLPEVVVEVVGGGGVGD